MTDLGYYDGPIDGVYGEATTEGVKTMQTDLGVTADGVYGAETHDALKGKGKSIVAALQTELRTYGYYDGPIDGAYGQETQDAVKKLQTDLGLDRGRQVRPRDRRCVRRRPSRTARSRRSRRDGLGRVRDLADDLDDVAVRVVDPQLPVGAVAAGEDRADPLELALGAELARVRLEVAQRPADELRDRDAVPPPGGEVHHGRLEPVAGGEPLVLGGQDPVVRRDLLAAVELLGVELDERLAERGDARPRPRAA